MNRGAAAAAALALIAVFAAVTVSVVDARRPLDERVSSSFNRTVAKLTAPSGTVVPQGCRKERLYYYSCYAAARSRHRPLSEVHWRLFLHDDGCWATIGSTLPAASPFAAAARRAGMLQGCTG